MSNFCSDTWGAVVVTFLGSLVQSCCGEGGTLQTNITGVCGACSQCFSHTELVPTHRVCFPILHCSGSRLLCQELSDAGPGFHAVPRSKPLRFRFLGTPQRHRFGWACVLCSSQVRAAQVTRCLASVISATYHLPHPCHSVFWVYNWHTFLGGCRPSRIPRSLG